MCGSEFTWDMYLPRDYFAHLLEVSPGQRLQVLEWEAGLPEVSR
ncbi:hypothetical protein [Lentzea sp. NPDC004782]